jgi:hypothetical protein
MASGEISHSLYGAGERGGLGAATLNELANVFEHDIDFSRDIRKGDRFHVLYEEVWRDGERLRNGGIVAASPCVSRRGSRREAGRREVEIAGHHVGREVPVLVDYDIGRLALRHSSNRKPRPPEALEQDVSRYQPFDDGAGDDEAIDAQQAAELEPLRFRPMNCARESRLG